MTLPARDFRPMWQAMCDDAQLAGELVEPRVARLAYGPPLTPARHASNHVSRWDRWRSRRFLRKQYPDSRWLDR